ncbi:MAG: hypothetical protein OXH26_03960 [bacterium]|nr:hypothetical protein [bacterium]
MDDPRCGQADSQEGDPGSGWREAGEELNDLRESFRSSYQQGSAEGPSRDDVMGALRTLGEAITHIAAGAGNTLKDPQVKQQVKKTTSSAMSVISGILLDFSADLRRRLGEKEQPRGQEEGTVADETVPSPDTGGGDAEDSNGGNAGSGAGESRA